MLFFFLLRLGWVFLFIHLFLLIFLLSSLDTSPTVVRVLREVYLFPFPFVIDGWGGGGEMLLH